MLKRISALFIGVALLALPAALPTFAQDSPAPAKTKAKKAKTDEHHEAEDTAAKPAKEKKSKKEKKADKSKEEKKTP